MKPLILVVGSAEMREAVADALAADDWELHFAADANAAVNSVLSGLQFDLVALEVWASTEPRRFIRRLRRLAPDTPVLAVSNHGGKSLLDQLQADALMRTPLEDSTALLQFVGAIPRRGGAATIKP